MVLSELLSFLVGFFLVGGGYTIYKVMKPEEVRVINKRDFVKILKRYELVDDFKAGKLICPLTKTVITYDNIGIIRKAPAFKKPIFISNSMDIMKQASQYPDEDLYRLSYAS